MINKIQRICVYASSSNDLDEVYYQTARELGLLIGKENFDVVYGGSRLGLMYATAGAVKEAGGKIYGVMPEKLANLGFANPDDCEEFYTTIGMRERKAKLDELSDAVIAISGGFGTLEELLELIVQKQLCYNTKPIVILNTNNFYRGLLLQFEEIIAQRFAHEKSKEIYHVASTPKEAIEYIKSYVPNADLAKFRLEK